MVASRNWISDLGNRSIRSFHLDCGFCGYPGLSKIFVIDERGDENRCAGKPPGHSPCFDAKFTRPVFSTGGPLHFTFLGSGGYGSGVRTADLHGGAKTAIVFTRDYRGCFLVSYHGLIHDATLLVLPVGLLGAASLNGSWVANRRIVVILSVILAGPTLLMQAGGSAYWLLALRVIGLLLLTVPHSKIKKAASLDESFWLVRTVMVLR